MRLDRFWCSLCGAYHTRSQLKDGWFAVGLRHNMKGADSAKWLICPDCLARISVTGICDILKKEGVNCEISFV